MADDPDWPDWLAAIYGPAPKGPRLRAEALRKDAERKAVIEKRLDGTPAAAAPMQPTTRAERTYTPDELRRARIALGIELGPQPSLGAGSEQQQAAE